MRQQQENGSHTKKCKSKIQTKKKGEEIKRLKGEKIKTYLVKNKIQILHKPVYKSNNINASTFQEFDFWKVRIKHICQSSFL